MILLFAYFGFFLYLCPLVLIITLFLCMHLLLILLQSALLIGTPIGSSPSVDYSSSSFPATTAVNTPPYAFDGDPATFFASYDRSNTWVGLQLDTTYVITRVGWMARNDGKGEQRMQLGLFEGANSPDFTDALPLYLIPSAGSIGNMLYADVSCSRAFRYVRYVGPNDARCNVAELAFYGYPSEGDDTQLYRPTNLPCVVIHTTSGHDPVDKVNDQVCIAQILGEDGSLLTDSATTRLRGNASATFEKKPYRIKFYSKQNVLDSPAKAKKWTLINNYGDKTLMRNLIAFHVSRIFGMPYTPFGRPVDVIMNGEYKGCYQLCDQVEVGKGRVDIKEMKATDIEGNALTGGYFWEIDAYANEEISWFNSSHNNPVTIKSPADDAITGEQSTYLRNYFNTMETYVYGSNYADSVSGWRHILDAETFLKHFLVGEFSGNTDTYWSVYQYKNRGEDKIYTGPVWDFDLAFNNDNRTYPIQNKKDYVYRSGGSAAGDMKNFVNRIVISDQNTKTELLQYWAAARRSGLTDTDLCAFVDSLAAELDASQGLNFTRWPMLTKYVHMNPQVAGSYQGEVNVVKNYITSRIAWMDSKLGFDPSVLSVEPVREQSKVEKKIHDGQLVLVRDGASYTVLGQKMSGK